MRTITIATVLTLTSALLACAGLEPGDKLLPPGVQTTHLETYRPQLHYTPQSGWMNDPNGLIWHDGTWHMFHQYIPGEYVIDQMNWGHATSTDLVHWTYRPMAITTNPDLGLAYSGSTIADPDNVTGLCTGDTADCVLAFFTHSLMLGGDQKQSLAVSSDGGMTFVEYDGNPVMPNPGMTNFRDPKVFMYDAAMAAAPMTDRIAPISTQWNMILAQGKQLGIYVSGNLVEWQPLSTIDNIDTWSGGVWECPDLFRMPVENDPGTFKWVLMVSVFDGAPWDGSGVMYFTGDFDGTTFTPDDPDLTPRWLDKGPDFYAAQTFSNVPDSDGRRVLVAWMNNWKYALGIPARPWQGAMAIPRQLSLIRDADGTFTITQMPVEEFIGLRRGRVTSMKSLASKSVEHPLYSSDSGIYEIEITAPRWDRWAIRIASSSDSAEAGEHLTNQAAAPIPTTENAVVRIGIDHGVLSVDRTDAGCGDCPASMKTTYSAELDTGIYGAGPEALVQDPVHRLVQADYLVTLRLLVDHSGIEVFADGGRTTMTAQAFLPGPTFSIFFETPDATADAPLTAESIEVHELFSIWAEL